MDSYDVVIIGTGQGGTPLAKAMAGAGKPTALIERADVGGTCINSGCTPTKTMVASARIAHLARRAADYGVDTGPVSVDLSKVRQRKRDIVASWREGSEKGIQDTEGLTLIRGDARFVSPDVVEVHPPDGAPLQLRAGTIVVSTGARARTPPIEGLSNVPTLDHRSIMELDEVPHHLLIVGGGYIGLEFGQMFRRFGAQITIIQRHSRILPHEDEDVTDAVTQVFAGDGIQVLFEREPVKAEAHADGIALTLQGGIARETRVGSHLLLAAGRQPNTDTLNLAAAGVETDDHGFIRVNEKLETTAANIFAIGDVKGGPAFTHIAYDDFRILRDNLLHAANRTITNRLVPYTVFIDPQLGRVGLTEAQARKRGHRVRVVKLPMSSVARAIETDETRGLMKAVVDADTNQILGAAILGIEGGEVASVLQMAMMGGVPYTAIRDGVFAHPTLAESLNNLFMKLGPAS